MARSDKPRQVLLEALRQLYGQAARVGPEGADNFLQGGDGKFLGRITDNLYDRNSITNPYGPYGSPYSPTSIHNEYSIYANPYSALSMNNIYATNAPILYLAGRERGRVTRNQFVHNRIDPEVFVYLLEHDVQSILNNQIPDAIPDLGPIVGRSYVLAADGTFLGSLNPNPYDQESIFNEYGPYGSKYSPTSIFNEFGTYGSKFSHLSPYNPYSYNHQFCIWMESRLAMCRRTNSSKELWFIQTT
ncbi:MAG: hypothetical protein ACE5HL_03350 [Terriglobia bacterium]